MEPLLVFVSTLILWVEDKDKYFHISQELTFCKTAAWYPSGGHKN